MPCEADAQHLLRSNILYAPGKASNAGGVAVSGLEQTQNAQRIYWALPEVDDKLQTIMHTIHQKCLTYGQNGGPRPDYVKGANIGGFIKVANALEACGVV